MARLNLGNVVAQHYMWAGGHFILLISALRYLLATVLFRGPSPWLESDIWSGIEFCFFSFLLSLVDFSFVLDFFSFEVETTADMTLLSAFLFFVKLVSVSVKLAERVSVVMKCFNVNPSTATSN